MLSHLTSLAGQASLRLLGGAGSQVPFSAHVKLTATKSQYVGNPELALSFLKEIYK